MIEYLDIKTPEKLMNTIFLFFIIVFISTLVFGIIPIFSPEQYPDSLEETKSFDIHDFSVKSNLILTIANSFALFSIGSLWMILSYRNYNKKLKKQ